MSLVAQALVITASRMLTGRTIAGENVYEQPLNPIATWYQGGEKVPLEPMLAVYVEDSEVVPHGMDISGQPTMVTQKVILYMPPSMAAESRQTGRAGWALNMMARQVNAVLRSNVAEWAPVWRRLVVSIKKQRNQFLLIETGDDNRVAAMEIAFSLEATAEPMFDSPANPAWEAFIAALDVISEARANEFRVAIEGSDTLTWEQVVQNNFGFTDSAMEAIGGAPMVPGEEPAVVETIDPIYGGGLDGE
jgi:hypothetical protein